MPILEKKGITVKDYMKERLQYAFFSSDRFIAMCKNSLKKEKDLMIIDGTIMFTIPLKNLAEYFKPKDEPVEAKEKE